MVDLYRRLVGIQFRSQLQYRIAFLLDLVSAGMNVAIYFVSLALILQRFQNLGGWTLGEIAFLYGMIEMAFGTMDMLFGGFDPSFFGQQVRRGTFDQVLLRPANVTVQVLGSQFLLRRLGRIAQGAVVFGLALSWVPIHWTPVKILYLPLVYLSLVAFFGGLFIIGGTITFWTIESIEVVNIFTYGGTEMMSYPMHIYQDWMRRFFTYVVPAIFLNYYPTLFFLDKPDPFHLPPFAPFLSPVVGLGTLLIALLFWQFGIRHYQSTGT